MLANMLARLGRASTLGLAASAAAVQAVSISEIQGPAWISPYAGQTVHNVTGVVVAKGPSGVWIQSAPSNDTRASSGLYVYGSSVVNKTALGDAISLSGKIAAYRSDPSYLYSTELTSPSALAVLSHNNTVAPLVLGGAGADRSPPTQSLSPLDAAAGPDGWLALPNNQSLVSAANGTLQPGAHGLDFWKSVEGMLVTVRAPVALGFPNSYGEFWVRGDWPATGVNGRGGLSITFGPDGVPDANPEAILVGGALDKSAQPAAILGTTLSDITGVVQYQFGYYYLLPLTAPTVLSTPAYDPPTAPFNASATSGDPCALTLADYNVENMGPRVAHLPVVAGHIVSALHTPDLLFLQEIQDNSGEGDDGTVAANVTLGKLVAAIAAAGGAFNYSWAEIDPVDGQDGGVPGGNIRPVYLYNPAKLTLVPGTPGGALDATAVTTDSTGAPALTFNPGRIDPANAAWNSSRKPLAAHWQTASGERFFTVDVHFASKSGSSPAQGDARPPVNGVVDGRAAQVAVVADFVKTLFAVDPNASLVLAGDMNEYTQTRAVFAPLAGLLHDADDAAAVPPAERYTYVFDQNSQEIDHVFVSPAVAARGVRLAHVHVNTWAPSLAARASDHDPTAALVRVCSNLQAFRGALGGLAAPAVTQRAHAYVVQGRAHALLAAARADSCTVQLGACFKAGLGDGPCAVQEAQCLGRVLASAS